MTWELEHEQELEAHNQLILNDMYKEACQRFGKFLDGQRKGGGSESKTKKRIRFIAKEFKAYGNTSLFVTCSKLVFDGYPLIVTTLHGLKRMEVNTKDDLLRFDTKNPWYHRSQFGPKRLKTATLLKDMFAAEKALQTNL